MYILPFMRIRALPKSGNVFFFRVKTGHCITIKLSVPPPPPSPQGLKYSNDPLTDRQFPIVPLYTLSAMNDPPSSPPPKPFDPPTQNLSRPRR